MVYLWCVDVLFLAATSTVHILRYSPVPEPVAPPKNEAAHALVAKHFSNLNLVVHCLLLNNLRV